MVGNAQDVNNTWLYAYNAGDEGVIQEYCATAWQYFWLLRLQGQLVTVWQNTDGTCDPVNGKWTLVDSYYIAYRWTYY
ncbi:MAG: hypothetical protein M1480_14235 [Bacteroidetes bacterium]|nr:hypothetical protein [Bacteroidota bacterium]